MTMATSEGMKIGATHGVWRSGEHMVMAEDAELPDRCVKTDRPADGEWADVRLRWHHPALYLVLLVGPIVYFIVAHFASTLVIVHVGITTAALASARRTRRLAWALLVAGIAFWVAAASAALMLLGWAGGALMLLSIPVFFLRGRLIWATRIEHGYVWIAGVHPDYLARLPEWPRDRPRGGWFA
jgi:hypothetical protein